MPDFQQVAASGIAFVVDKATESTGYVNPRFAQTWPAIKAAGLLRGVYHYAKPDSSSPEDEAAHFLATVQPALEPGDVLALDMEEGTGNLLDWTLRWLRTVEAAVGCKPLFYSGNYFMVPHGLTGNAELAQHGLWLAAYQAQPPPLPDPWEFIAIWQMSGSGTVPGVAGQVDLDLFLGDADQFRAYGVPAASPPSKPPLSNNDIVQTERYLLADPPDVAGAIAYLEPFR